VIGSRCRRFHDTFSKKRIALSPHSPYICIGSDFNQTTVKCSALLTKRGRYDGRLP
jgi:hypothetical protein